MRRLAWPLAVLAFMLVGLTMPSCMDNRYEPPDCDSCETLAR